MFRNIYHKLLYLLCLAAILPALSACASQPDSPAAEGNTAPQPAAASTTATDSSQTVPAPGVIIDVRTPQEFAAGHLEGAQNFDIKSPDFEKNLSSLDKSGTYYLYCRSGARAGAAAQIMQQAGFKTVTNLGGLDEAAQALNLEITK